jgi:ribulose-5-phosphate 4-epimerase/fuculose-1-phosphate aldolase
VSEARVTADLIAGCAILDGEGLTNAFGHLSGRLPSGEILISSSPGPGLVRAPQDLLRIDGLGELIEGDAALVPGEAAIHVRILARRDDVTSVCRFHGPACLAYSTLGRTLSASIGMGLFLGAEVAWFDTSSTVRTSEHGDRLAAALGSGAGVLLRGFGAVTVGRSVAEAVVRAWLVERSAQATLTASAVGTPIPYPIEAAEPFNAPDGPAVAQIARAWRYLRWRWSREDTIQTAEEVLRA